MSAVLMAILILNPSAAGEEVAPAAGDWPQWRGPERNGISRATGLLKGWPKEGPPLLWEAAGVGDGFSSMAVARGRVFTQGNVGEESLVIALDLESGKQLWAVPNGKAYHNSYGDGPRGTPTVEGDVLYALGAHGDLACIETATGKGRWSLNILKKFNAENIGWGLSESPLVAGPRLLCTPGGRDATVVALDKQTGETLWTSKGLSDQAAYSSLIAVDTGGVSQVVNFTHSGVVGVALEDGRFLWRFDRAANGTANIATPLARGGEVFVTSAYGTGCALIRLRVQAIKEEGNREGKKVVAEEVYFNRDLKNHHGGVLLVGEHVYGYSDNILTCMEWKSGKVAWKDRSVGKGALIFADGRLYLLSEDGKVGLAEASPERYKEISSFEIEHGKQPSWAHPVIAEGRLLLRTQDRVRCYDLAAPAAAGG